MNIVYKDIKHWIIKTNPMWIVCRRGKILFYRKEENGYKKIVI